jgi:hypothetical protein
MTDLLHRYLRPVTLVVIGGLLAAAAAGCSGTPQSNVSTGSIPGSEPVNGSRPASSSTGNGGNAQQLLAAVDATRKAASFTVIVTSDEQSGSSVRVFQAPDRWQSTEPVEPAAAGPPLSSTVEEVVIGNDQWTKDPSGSGRWTQQTGPSAWGTDTVNAATLGLFSVLDGAKDVTTTATGYSFKAAGGTGTVTVKDGFLDTVVIDQPSGTAPSGGSYPARTMRSVFSAIDSSPVVAAPPKDLVDVGSALGQCGSTPTPVPCAPGPTS